MTLTLTLTLFNMNTIILEPQASPAKTGMQEAIYEVEAFLSENYLFRRNILSGKTEVATALTTEGEEAQWVPVTVEV